jgi:hypothetical protein
MVRRSSILVTALAVGLLVYGFLLTATMRQALMTFCRPCCMHSDPHTASGVARSTQNGPTRIDILGVPVPLSTLIAAALTLPGMALTNDIVTWRRRRKRERLDQCLECGRPIRRFRGRCPGCGERLGPG